MSSVQEVYDNLHKAMDSLVSANAAFRRMHPDDIKTSMGAAAYALAFGTVQCNPGRRTGKTTYIQRRATADDLIIVHDGRIALLDFRENYNVAAPAYFRMGQEELPDPEIYKTIYIDEPSAVFALVDKRIIYEALAVQGVHQTFVLLGD